jgi:4-hydroxy-2-oxovalerate aldolase
VKKEFTILETTLRDGSYAVNFSFTTQDTAIICKKFEEAGFEYIEIGHGVGLNASKMGYGETAQTDEEYMTAAANALKKSKFGMFCIPGIARLEDIDIAAEHNMGFVRIGTNVTEVEGSERFIKKAKEYGMFVFANFMKSYTLEPKQFAEKVKLSQKFGADVVYVVDSAGGMFPDNVRDYYNAIKDVSDVSLGFHGHNNLSMAVSNTLEAIKLGFGFVDSSLQGLGRSSGNAATEVLIAVLIKLGYDVKVDFLKVLDIGYSYINPIIASKGIHPLDVVSGYADFHSSYMHLIHKYSAKYSIDPAILIIEMSKIDKINVDEKILEGIARKIKKNTSLFIGKYNFSRYVGSEQDER